jgi:hypothetical protein
MKNPPPRLMANSQSMAESTGRNRTRTKTSDNAIKDEITVVALLQRKPNERQCHYEAAVFAMPRFMNLSCDIARTFKFHSRSCTE